MSDTVPILAIIFSFLSTLILFLSNYLRETKFKQTSKIYQMKLDFYLELMEEITSIIYLGCNIKQNINKLYQKALILSSDQVIREYNSLLSRLDETKWEMKENSDIKLAQKLLIEYRKDLGLKTALSSYEIKKPFN
ncbi:hypothetical protein NEF87_002528 [Candidatus Lokiarchaeum ossiferum]|uniref:Uncharacterized protein n=1 Tax=Candidatus Lokiarchaeum ossiferum TaxID=2951803 RepID=A0ABY6HRV3_9ARCH|nr:hypothetical protein NEF87_002528 [Candidatus Lokiarchaeum sp. B-35]